MAMAMSTTLEQIAADLKLAESEKHELSKTYQELFSHSSSILSLTLQWQDLQSHFDAIEASLRTRFHVLESKEHSIGARIKDLEAREAEFDLLVKNYEAYKLRMKSLEVRSKKTTTITPEIKTERSKLVDDDCCGKGVELRFSVSMDGNGLQSFLNERVDEHERIGDEVLAAMRMSLDPARLVLDAVEGFYPLSSPRLRKGGKVFELGVVRRSCILLLEQLIRTCPKIRPSVREVAKGVAVEWKGKMGVEELEVLGFLLLVGVYGLVPEFDKDEIEKFFGVVEKHRLASQLRHLLGITDNIAVRSIILPAKIDQSLPQNPEMNIRAASPSESPWPELKAFSINMDGDGLRFYLSEHVKEHEAMQSEVYDALQVASDPVKLVLDAVQGLNSSNSDRVKHFKLGVSKRSCILLLAQLMKLSPQIELVTKEAAMEIAVEWKGDFLKLKQKPVKVLGFLQLVATFELISSFDADELLCLLKTVYQHISATDLFRVLDLFPKFVHFFIKKKNLPKAVRYIYAFDLVDKFPPVQLLKAHVDYWMFRSNKLCKERHLAQSVATKKEVNALRAVIKCIADFKLESEYAPDILEKRITLLEKETEDRKCTEPTPASNAQSLMQSEVKHSRTVISGVDGQSAPASTSSIVHSSCPSISSTIHPIQPTTSSTIQPNQPSVIEHSQTVTSTADTQHLEPEFPPKILEDRIAELENQKADTLKVLNSEPRCGPVTRLLFQGKSERNHTASATVTASPSTTNSPTPAPVHIHVPAPAPASEVQQQQQSGNKRPRTTESAETASNDSVGATSTIHSEQNPAKWNASSHRNHGVHYSTRCYSWNSFPPNNQNIGSYSNMNISYYPRDALRPVTKCIADFKLQSEYAPDILEKRIPLLEKKCEDGKCTEPTPASNAQPHMQSEANRSRTVISTVDAQNAPAGTSSIVHSSRPSISSTIHQIQSTTSSTIQPNQPIVIEHSQTVISTADTQHLEPEFPPTILEDRIAELGNQKADTLKAVNSKPRCGPVTTLLFQQKIERNHTASTTVTASPSTTKFLTPAPVHVNVPVPAPVHVNVPVPVHVNVPASEAQPLQQSENKRPRTTESAETAPNDVAGAISTIHSEQNPAKWNTSSHMNHGVHCSTRCYSLNGFPPNNQNIGLYSNRPISYYPRPALRPVYYNKPVAYGGPCQAVKQPGYYDHPMSFGGHGNGYKGPNHNGQAHSGAQYDPLNP